MARRGRPTTSTAPGRLRRNAPMWAAGLATIACALLYVGHRAGFSPIESLESWELATIDARFRLRGKRAPRSEDIVIVGLDDETRRLRPDLIQTRRGWADLVDGLSSYEPALVALDIFFQAPEVNLSPPTVSAVRDAHRSLRTATPQTPATRAATEALAAVIEETSGDALFAQSIEAAGNLVLAFVFGFDGATDTASEPSAIRAARVGESVRLDAPARARPPQASWVASSLEEFATHQVGAGFVNALPDVDGHVRRIPLVIEFGERTYQSLAVSAVAGIEKSHLSYLTGASTAVLGERELPIDHRGRALLSFLGPSGGATFTQIPAHRVAARQVPRETLAGKLVFVGYTDTARDVVATPFDSAFDGVELHATLAHNIIYDELLRKPTIVFTLLTIVIFGALITLLSYRRIRHRRSWSAAAAAIVLVAGYLLTSHLLFASGFVLELVTPIGSTFIIVLAALVAALATEGREKASLRAAFSQYVQGTLVDRILSDPSRARLGGVRRELTVLFSDIRGFSSFSETLEPERLSSFLNEYLTPMTELVMENGGMLDKYIGDAIMAVYGAPLELADHAERACASALRMAAALEPLNREWHARNLPEIHIGVGINSGPMSVGNMGSEARFDYTVVGDAVNLGARLEALTKEVGATILCGEATAAAAGSAFVFRELGSVRIHGRESVAAVFELIAKSGDSPISDDDLSIYATAVASFRAQQWQEAADSVSKFLASNPSDKPAAHLRAEIDAHRKLSLDSDWDGAFPQRAK